MGSLAWPGTSLLFFKKGNFQVDKICGWRGLHFSPRASSEQLTVTMSLCLLPHPNTTHTLCYVSSPRKNRSMAHQMETREEKRFFRVLLASLITKKIVFCCFPCFYLAEKIWEKKCGREVESQESDLFGTEKLRNEWHGLKKKTVALNYSDFGHPSCDDKGFRATNFVSRK